MSDASLPQGPVAFVFPGQGSQFVGMGSALADASPAARSCLEEANDILGVDLISLMAHGPAETLSDTYNAQPAILAVSVAALEALRERLAAIGTTFDAAAVAGHSLGEFSALVAAGTLSHVDALRLVRERGRLMKDVGTSAPGGMAAILGLDDDAIATVCQQASEVGVVVPANRNCPGQIVISGEVAALERAMELAKEAGARRAARLDVSIASHSPLMADANAAFGAILEQVVLRDPNMPLIGNVSAQPLKDVDSIGLELRMQMEHPVDWTRSVQTIVGSGIRTFVEIGPGNVLAGLIKRIDREATTLGLQDLGLDLPGAITSRE
jgi:[acyl-carrier-protein] S-malonyltransferase